jgi:hypothetical protein
MQLSDETIKFLEHEIYWQIVLRQRANTTNIHKCQWALKDNSVSQEIKEDYKRMLQQFTERKEETLRIKAELKLFLETLKVSCEVG